MGKIAPPKLTLLKELFKQLIWRCDCRLFTEPTSKGGRLLYQKLSNAVDLRNSWDYFILHYVFFVPCTRLESHQRWTTMKTHFWCLTLECILCTHVGYIFALAYVSLLHSNYRLWLSFVQPACSHTEGCQIWVCALVVCVWIYVHTHNTHTMYGYQTEPMISFHSDTWFPWKVCDTTGEQKGTWTQSSAYLQHKPLLIKGN